MPGSRIGRALVLALLATLLLRPPPASALTFELTERPDGHTVLTAKGIITPADFHPFLEFVNTMPKIRRLALLVIDSPGGVVHVAAQMASTVHDIGLPVAIPGGGKCASACVLLFAAAPRRMVGDGAQIGVHRASFLGKVENTSSQGATDGMALHFEQYGVPKAIIEKVRQTPPDGIAWLTPDDLKLMHAVRYPPPAETASR